jgi:hypothetical protein
VSDRLYLSCWLENFNEATMLRHFGKMLELFPFSKLAKRGPILRIYAIEHTEPPLVEREFHLGAEPSAILDFAREFVHDDCACEVDAYWDLWQYDGDWKLAPASVMLACFGPSFENENGDHLRIDFGIDAQFLPFPSMPGGLRMAQSNIRSLLHLVEEMERGLDLERRALWSESGTNFADVLKQVLGSFTVN